MFKSHRAPDPREKGESFDHGVTPEVKVGSQHARADVSLTLSAASGLSLWRLPIDTTDHLHVEQGVALLVVTHAPEVARQFPRRLRLEDFNRAAIELIVQRLGAAR
jgi:hypothetical protein